MPGRPQHGSRSRSIAVVILLLASTTLAGCSLLQEPAGGVASPDGEEAATRAGDLASVQLTLNTTLRRGGNASWSIQRISMRPGTDEFRNEIRATGSGSAGENGSFPPGTLIVSNGSVRYIYPADSDRVHRSELSGQSRNRSAEMRRLFAALEDDGTDTIRHPTPGISVLPTVPTGNGSGEPDDASVRWREGNVTARYGGTATVAGRTTYVVELRPADDDSRLVESTLWLETEYLYPVKRHRVIERDGERHEFTAVAQNLTFNPDFPDGTFEFDADSLGSDVTVVDTASYDSRDRMVADLDRPVPDPEVPDGFEFERGYYSDGERRHLSVTYENGSGEGSIRVSVFDEPANLTDGRRVSLDGQPAVFSSFEDRRFMVWNMEGQQYSVSGTVGNSTLRQVAESVVAD